MNNVLIGSFSKHFVYHNTEVTNHFSMNQRNTRTKEAEIMSFLSRKRARMLFYDILWISSWREILRMSSNRVLSLCFYFFFFFCDVRYPIFRDKFYFKNSGFIRYLNFGNILELSNLILHKILRTMIIILKIQERYSF